MHMNSSSGGSGSSAAPFAGRHAFAAPAAVTYTLTPFTPEPSPPTANDIRRLQDENAALKAQLLTLSSSQSIHSCSSSSVPLPLPLSVPSSIAQRPIANVVYLSCDRLLRRHLDNLIAQVGPTNSPFPPPRGSVMYFWTFCLDTLGYARMPAEVYKPDAEDLWSVPRYTALASTLPLPYPSALQPFPSLASLLSALSLCFNCGSPSHALRECRLERDPPVIHANSAAYRTWTVIRDRQRTEKEDMRDERDHARSRYYDPQPSADDVDPTTDSYPQEPLDERKAQVGDSVTHLAADAPAEGRSEYQQLVQRLLQSGKLADVADVLVIDDELRDAEQLRALQKEHRRRRHSHRFVPAALPHPRLSSPPAQPAPPPRSSRPPPSRASPLPINGSLHPTPTPAPELPAPKHTAAAAHEHTASAIKKWTPARRKREASPDASSTSSSPPLSPPASSAHSPSPPSASIG